MSLPNPNKTVTEERLNEYHNTILPYLGGMPDILANKFARGDMYSTDEKMIGRWTNGKPLYQKTAEINFGNYPKNTWSDIGFAIGNYEYGYIVNASVWKSDIGFISLPYLDYGTVKIAPDGSIQIYNVNLDWPTKLYVTVQYTKTTDSSVEIGLDTDYSTTEKIVGTWIDGKPLYQKVYQTNAPTSGDGTIVTLDSNMQVINMFGGILNASSLVPLNTPQNTYGYGLRTYVDMAGNSVKQTVSGDSWKGLPEIVVLQYTKATN